MNDAKNIKNRGDFFTAHHARDAIVGKFKIEFWVVILEKRERLEKYVIKFALVSERLNPISAVISCGYATGAARNGIFTHKQNRLA